MLDRCACLFLELDATQLEIDEICYILVKKDEKDPESFSTFRERLKYLQVIVYRIMLPYVVAY